MKSNFTAFAAPILFALALASCSNHKSPAASPDIAGSWRLDSVVRAHDTTASTLPMIMTALAAGDSSTVTYTFRGDSIEVASGTERIETAPYRYEKPQITLLDSSREKLDVIRPSDSALILRTSDSARMYFTRQ